MYHKQNKKEMQGKFEKKSEYVPTFSYFDTNENKKIEALQLLLWRALGDSNSRPFDS